MSTIGSYVFFDIETTGLPYVDIGDTKMTELTLMGVARDHFNFETFEAPRVVNTMTLCVNPMGHIGLVASKMTGLTNDLLNVMGPFDEKVINSIASFIERLPQPSCLISHNGDRFDFPILQSQLKAANMALPDSLLCGDTLTAFRDLKVMERDPSEWKLMTVKPVEDKLETPLAIPAYIDEIEKTCKELHLFNDEDNFLFNQIDEEQILSQCSGYSTPKKPTTTTNKRQTNSFVRTPVKNKPQNHDVRTETTPKVKRRLYTANSPSYKLVSVHNHVTGKDIVDAHTSQSDTAALLSIVTAVGQPFHQWLQENNKLFSTIKRLW